MTALAFVDLETTGLDPDRHEPWEIAIIRRDPDGSVTTVHWDVEVDLSRADAGALRIGGYYRRRDAAGELWNAVEAPRDVDAVDPDDWHIVGRVESQLAAEDVAEALADAHLVGAVPSFDAAFLDRWLRRNGQAPAWHYHLIDVEALAAGHARVAPPWNSNDLSRAVGVEPDEFGRHTAMGDVRWAMAIYDAVMGGGS